jgi:hypothetical protein
MNDTQFLKSINQITAKHHLKLPVIRDANPPGAAVSAWAGFLELCVKNGIKISDPRWRRVSFAKQEPVTVFELHAATAEPGDPDFRIGLQLLIGMLERDGAP